MRHLLALSLAIVLLAPSIGGQQPSFRSSTTLVQVDVIARGKKGFIADLRREDFTVLEDGVPQRIAFFAPGRDVPLNLGLIADFSGSQDPFIKSHHKDLESFLTTALGPADRAFLLCFGNLLRLASEFTASPEELVRSLRAYEKGERRGFPELGPIEDRTAGTAFYDAIYYSATEMFAKTERGRKALIVFSDGEDNSSAHHEMETLEAAQANDVVLFCVRYTDAKNGRLNARNKYGASVMERLARETGGADFDARKMELTAHFQAIAAQLRSSYELAYHSSNPVDDNSFHKITVRVKRPGAAVRAKSGYYGR
jgi:Ca-activated chloride channel family protein